MQLIRIGFSRRFSALRWAAVTLTLGVALWLIFALPGTWGVVAAIAAVLPVAAVLRARNPAGSLRLRREGFCEWIAPGAAPIEMVVDGLFGEAGWLVLRLTGREGGRPGGKSGVTLVLAPDAVVAEEQRQLRVWLRLAAPRATLNSRSLQWS
jgi:hypothetical protein